ncbi:hypothetical protein R6Q59_022072 [Mikania micrantha]
MLTFLTRTQTGFVSSNKHRKTSGSCRKLTHIFLDGRKYIFFVQALKVGHDWHDVDVLTVLGPGFLRSSAGDPLFLSFSSKFEGFFSIEFDPLEPLKDRRKSKHFSF